MPMTVIVNRILDDILDAQVSPLDEDEAARLRPHTVHSFQPAGGHSSPGRFFPVWYSDRALAHHRRAVSERGRTSVSRGRRRLRLRGGSSRV